MSTVTVVVKGLQRKCKADFWVWLDKILGDFSQVEINPETYLVTTGNVQCVESLCNERNISIACNDVIFVDIANKAIQNIGLTEAEYLAIEQFLTTQNENELTSTLVHDDGDDDITESHNETFGYFTKSYGKESDEANYKSDAEIKTSNISLGNVKQEKKKLDYLKSYERVILYKMKFIENLVNSDLVAKHKSPGKAPVLIGSRISIEEAEFDIMKFLRRIVQQEIKFLDEMTDEFETSLMGIKIISYLENKFQNDPLDFELKKDHITIYSVEVEKFEELKRYLKDNFYQEFIPVNDAQKFKYIESNLSKDINILVNDCIRIVARSTSSRCGYSMLGFGSKSGFEESKNELKRIINCVESTEITLNVPNISENLELIMAGIERKWNAVVKVLNFGSTTGNIIQASIKGITVTLIHGRIEDQNVDVIVNSAGKDLNLNSGHLSKAIFLKAGEDLQKECRSKGSLSFGQVVESKAYNLPSKFVFHCLAKHWNKSKSKESLEILANIVHKCLEMANSKGATSIAFPPINCGYLEMPVKMSAECILGAIESFIWDARHTLKNIRIVICNQNNSNFQEFQQILNANLSKPCSSWKYAEGVKVSIIASDKERLQGAYVGLSAAILK